MINKKIMSRYFEDFTIGEEFIGKPKIITHKQIVKYSGASGDFNPIHTDKDAAIKAGLGGVIAHGLMSLAFLGEMMTDWLKDPSALKVLRGRFSRMVRPGDTITAKGIVIEKKIIDNNGIVIFEITAENQHLEKVISNGIAEAHLPMRQNL